MNKRLISALAIAAVIGATGVAQAQQQSSLPAGMPQIFQTVPDKAQAGFWDAYKAIVGPNNAIPPKYEALISLAVSAQIPCEYCIYATTKNAQKAGASAEEIRQAIAIAGMTRFISAVENGNQVDFDKFKAAYGSPK